MNATVTVKPPYVVPSMADVRAAYSDHGKMVASLFSGAGGSSLGYRLAGCRVVYASEFVPAASATYAANTGPGTFLDTRDVREITGEDLLEKVGIDVGELDILDGSPPCSPFSTAGKRSAHWGQVVDYSGLEQRTDDLFYEFARLVDEVRPRAFVAENVPGLVSGAAKGYFKEIFRALQSAGPGYRVKARILNAAHYGVPQDRRRLIFVGLRDDSAAPFGSVRRPVYGYPSHPAPLSYTYSLRDALPYVEAQCGGPFGTTALYSSAISPSKTLGASPSTGNGASPPAMVVGGGPTVDEETGHDLRVIGRAINRRLPGVEIRFLSLAELRLLASFPADFALTGTFAQRWERIGRAVPPLLMKAIATHVSRSLDGWGTA